jgi:1-acyl-sn-glycerol-3-phosphate acyltransferase
MQTQVADETVSETARPESHPLRGVLVSAFRRVMRLYFRNIERVGVPPGRDTRGRVIVSNHTNALIDPVLVLTDAACEISPVAKSTLWSIPGLRWLLDRAGAVPIVRRKDTPDKDATQNSAIFEKIAQHLAGGGNILIFPEGTHSGHGSRRSDWCSPAGGRRQARDRADVPGGRAGVRRALRLSLALPGPVGPRPPLRRSHR